MAGLLLLVYWTSKYSVQWSQPQHSDFWRLPGNILSTSCVNKLKWPRVGSWVDWNRVLFRSLLSRSQLVATNVSLCFPGHSCLVCSFSGKEEIAFEDTTSSSASVYVFLSVITIQAILRLWGMVNTDSP